MFNKDRKKDDDVIIYDENDSIQRSRQKSRRVFVFYIVALFCVALFIILASYIMQANQQQQLEAIGARLDKQTDVAQGAKSRAEKIQTELDELQKRANELQKRLDETTGDLDEQRDYNEKLKRDLDKEKVQSEALNDLWKLEKAYQNNDMNKAKSIIDKMDKKYGHARLISTKEQPLTNQAAKEYNNICEATASE